MKVIIAPSPLLRNKTKSVGKVTPALVKTAREMIKLAESFIDPEGVGLAAPQVGIAESFFVAKLFEGKGFDLYINPQILSFGKKERKFLEGCLSIPNYYGQIQRPAIIRVGYINQSGEKVSRNLKGTAAMIFQHEYDHLQGKLFMDLVLVQNARLLKVVGKDKAGAEIFQEVTL